MEKRSKIKKAVNVIIVVIVFAAVVKGGLLYRKYSHAKNLVFGVDGVKTVGFEDILTNPLAARQIRVSVLVKNFSSTTFHIQQASVNINTEKGTLIAEPDAPITDPIELLPDKNTILDIAYNLSAKGMRDLIKDSGGILAVGKNFLSTGKLGLKIKLQGFVLAEGIKIKVNEPIEF